MTKKEHLVCASCLFHNEDTGNDQHINYLCDTHLEKDGYCAVCKEFTINAEPLTSTEGLKAYNNIKD